MGVRIAVVTLAERGSVVFDGNRMAHVPAYKVNAVDPTGAGDTYAAGFIHHYLRTADPFEAGLFGSAVASVMVEHVGPDFPLTPECAQARFEYLRDVVSSGPEPA
jgi:sugar/nucleoside kinase (ribokinase family)